MIDIKSQRIATQLYHFYLNLEEIDPLGRSYSHLHLDFVYDWLKSEGIKMDFDKETKDKLKALGKSECTHQHPAWIKAFNGTNQVLKETAKELLQAELKRFYKTYFTRKYLYDIFKSENRVVKLLDQLGEEIKPNSFMMKNG